jgi:hypothetical protein
VGSNGAGLLNYNFLSTQLLSSYGLSLNNPADVATLAATLNSPAAGRFQNKVPYAGFPLTSTVAQSLRPFPQFNSGLAALWAPLGNSWYDSLQTKVTKAVLPRVGFHLLFYIVEGAGYYQRSQRCAKPGERQESFR